MKEWGAMRLALVGLLLLLAAAPASAEFPDWSSLSDVKVIEVLTRDEDGDARATKVWFVLLGGDPFLRTNDSRWLENIRRDPIIGLRIEGREYRARAEEIEGDEIVEKVDIASKQKYGFQETLIHVFRMGRPQILQLSSAEEAAE